MYQLIGFNPSPYSVKMRAVLRYRRLPFIWDNRTDAREVAQRHRLPPVIPVLVMPDGAVMNDSTPLIHELDPHLSAGGQGTISGLVRDSGNCTRIAGATVTAGGASAVSDSNGHYSLTLPAGQPPYTVSTSVSGWNDSTLSATVNEAYDSDLNFFLTAKNSCVVSTANRTVTICEPAG